MFIASVCTAVMVACLGTAKLPDEWTPKFYAGLEAVGSVTWKPDAFKAFKGRPVRVKTAIVKGHVIASCFIPENILRVKHDTCTEMVCADNVDGNGARLDFRAGCASAWI